MALMDQKGEAAAQKLEVYNMTKASHADAANRGEESRFI
jgi:hypothetical protein